MVLMRVIVVRGLQFLKKREIAVLLTLAAIIDAITIIWLFVAAK